MAFLRAPSIQTSADLTTERRTPSPRPPRDHDVCDGLHGLPEGSSLFREVMAELQPPSPNPSPQSCRSPNPRRRKTSQVRHVHYVDQAKRNEGSSPKPKEAEVGAEEEEPAGPEKQILHGKCHCYFVENGNVTGLADHQCQHEHRLHPPAQLSPLSSPRPSRRLTPTTTTTPTPTGSSTPTPEGSPTSRRKHHHQPHHHTHHNHHTSSLQPPPEGLSRGRSNSDVGPAGLGRVLSAKRTSLSPSPNPTTTTTTTTSPHRRKASTSSLHTSPNRGGGGGGSGGGSSPDRQRPSTGGGHRRSWSARHAERNLSDGLASSSLRVSPSPHPLPHLLPPPPILVQDTSEPGGVGGDRDASRVQSGGEGGRRSARRMSTHAVASDQLHYLYDQFLASGASGASGASSASSTGH